MSISDENTTNQSSMSDENTTKAEVFRKLGSIIELTEMLSEQIWRDNANTDVLLLTGLADGANAIAIQLQALVEASEMS
ncbi:MAG: hypothetical protein Q8Q40_10115 [Methylococcaceae bacterium]|nr:hypothetical protein [Methylococcaceae bacterium]MDP3904318.1 hypothetical protein [Methylococcaceae bacterium]